MTFDELKNLEKRKRAIFDGDDRGRKYWYLAESECPFKEEVHRCDSDCPHFSVATSLAAMIPVAYAELTCGGVTRLIPLEITD